MLEVLSLSDMLLLLLLLLLVLHLLPQLLPSVMISRCQAVNLLTILLLARLVLEGGLLVGHEPLGVGEALRKHRERGMAICHKWAGPVSAVAEVVAVDVAVTSNVEQSFRRTRATGWATGDRGGTGKEEEGPLQSWPWESRDESDRKRHASHPRHRVTHRPAPDATTAVSGRLVTTTTTKADSQPSLCCIIVLLFL